MRDKVNSQLPPEFTAIKGDKALESVMRDVLEGMQEFATLANFSPRSIGGYEIIAVEKANQENTAITDTPTGEKAEVIPLRRGRGYAA
jgi:hypothetical protein